MPESQYEPGNCNIGAKELFVRKKIFRFFSVVLLAFSVLACFYYRSLACWALLFFSSFTLAVLYLQIKYRFCVLFGFFNLYNFGSPGELKDVVEIEHSRKDRKRVANMMLKALMVSAAYAGLLSLLITQYHS